MLFTRSASLLTGFSRIQCQEFIDVDSEFEHVATKEGVDFYPGMSKMGVVDLTLSEEAQDKSILFKFNAALLKAGESIFMLVIHQPCHNLYKELTR